MKLRFLLCSVILLAVGGSAFAQGVRFSSTITQQGTVGSSTNVVTLPSNPAVAICAHPANAVPCTNKITTFTDQTLTTSCLTSVQIVLDGTTTCVASPDARNNWGFWAAPNSSGYDYTYTVGGQSFGPFNVLQQTNIVPSLTVSGALLASAQTNKLCSNNGVLLVDSANTCGWTGSDTGAQINSAIAALPTCNPYPSYNYGNSTFSFSAKCGDIYIPTNALTPSGGYTISTPVVIVSSMVRLIGAEKISTQIQCGTTSPCIQFLMGNSAGASHAGGTVTAGPSPVMSVRGGFENLSINGSSTASQIGVQCNDCTGAVLKDFRISNFSGTGAIGLYLLNDLDGITEEMAMDNPAFEGNTNNVVMDAPNAPLLSFNHNNWHHLKFSVGNGQTAITAKNNAQWSGSLDGVVNFVCTAACTGISILNTAKMNGLNNLMYDGTGAANLTLCSGCTSSNTQFWGFGAGSSQGVTNNGALNNKDQLWTINQTASGTAGIAFQINGVTQEIMIPTNGTGDWALWNAGITRQLLDVPAAGGFLGIGGTSGCCTFLLPGTASPSNNLTLPTIADTLVGRATADTFTAAKTFGAGSSLNVASLLISPTLPTIAAAGCGGAAASIVVANGTASFKVNVGTTPGSACTLTFPAATTGWNVHCDDITTQSTSVFVQKQTGAESTTSVTITNFSDVAVATAFVASDILKCTASAD